MRTWLVAALCALCLLAAVPARADELSTLKTEMRRLEATIDRLESRTGPDDAELRRLRLALEEIRRRIYRGNTYREWFPERTAPVNGFHFAADTAGFVLLREGMGDGFRGRVISDMHGQVVRLDGYLFDATDGFMIVPVDHPYRDRFRGKPVAEGCGWWEGMFSGEASGTPVHIPTLDICAAGEGQPRFFPVFFLSPGDVARPRDLTELRYHPRLYTRTDYRDRSERHRVVVEGVVDGALERPAPYPEGPRRVVAISLRDWLRVP